MKKTTAFVIFALIVGLIGIGAWAGISKWLKAREQQIVEQSSSDAKNITTTLRVAGDSWVGYTILRSGEFRRFLEAEGIGVKFTDDAADYAGRMAKFAAGEYDIVVSTLDAYLLNAKPHDYPGVIVFVVDESKGGDAIVAAKDVASLMALASPSMKIALTPNSPSDFLLRAVASHFDLVPLKVKGPWRKEVGGSEAALKELQAGNVRAAVLWEPDLTAALADARFHKLIGTEKTEGLILDVCIASRKLVVENPDAVRAFVRNYFQALRFYEADPAAFADLVAKDAKTTPEKSKAMLGGVDFASLSENATRWFGIAPPGTAAGIAREGLIDSIAANADVLAETGALAADPLGGNPRRIVNSSFVETLRQQGLGKTGGIIKVDPDAGSGPVAPAFTFAALDDAAWKALRVVGLMKARPIYFQSGTSLLALEGKLSIDAVAADLAHYPTYRILARGHTTPEGDEEQNIALSRERADAVKSYLIRVHGIPAERIRAEGVGGAQPLPKDEGESDRRWKGRLPRVEFYLVEDPRVE